MGTLTEPLLINMLVESCEHLEQSEGLLRFVGYSASGAAQRLIEDVQALRHRLNDECVQPAEWRHLFDPQLLVLDLVTVRVSEWAEFWRGVAKDGQQLCWQSEPDAEDAHQAVQTLLVSLANSLVAARILVLKGLFVQARTLARAFGEMADLTIAALHDREVLSAYLATHEDFDRVYETWRTRLSPGQLRAINERLWGEIGFTEEIKAYLADRAKSDQRWLSLAAHNYSLALTIGTMAHDVTQPIRGDEEFEVSVSLQAGIPTLEKLIDQSSHFLSLFLHLLNTRHRWMGDRTNEKQRWSYFREQVMRDIWLRYLVENEEDDELDHSDQAPETISE
jgi:hypothetical protein